MEGIDIDDSMAAFRQAARGRGWIKRAEMLRAVARLLGYQRLIPRLKTTLQGHMRAAIRRGILEPDDDCVRALCVTMDGYTREALRDAIRSVMRSGTIYDREDVIRAVARHLGFSRVSDTVRRPIKSAINSAIRQGVLGYEGNVIWRMQ